jgi:hypothetical protein
LAHALRSGVSYDNAQRTSLIFNPNVCALTAPFDTDHRSIGPATSLAALKPIPMFTQADRKTPVSAKNVSANIGRFLRTELGILDGAPSLAALVRHDQLPPQPATCTRQGGRRAHRP